MLIVPAFLSNRRVVMIIRATPVLLQVVYYLPDYPSVLNEFTWGYNDSLPELMKTHRFLRHWHANIKAVIAEVLISINDGPTRNWRAVDEIIGYN